jgi:hypothetical protein
MSYDAAANAIERGTGLVLYKAYGDFTANVDVTEQTVEGDTIAPVTNATVNSANQSPSQRLGSAITSLAPGTLALLAAIVIGIVLWLTQGKK